MSQCVKIVFLQNFGLSKKRFSKRKLHVLFFFFMLEKRNRKKKKKQKREITKNPIKIGFLEVVIQKCEKSKKIDF